jgi:hypothetical protein
MKIIFHHQGSATGGCGGCKTKLLPRFLSMGKTQVGAGYLTLQNVTDILDKGGGQSITKLHEKIRYEKTVTTILYHLKGTFE